MIEFLQQQLSSENNDEKKGNRLREALQLLCLKILHDKGYLTKIAFVGGTVLRVIYDLRRFSEDLDFSVVEKSGYEFSEMISTVEREFGLSGLEIKAKNRINKTVQGSMLKFPSLLKKMGLSPLESQNLSIELEVDSNPPQGWHIETSLVTKTYVLNIMHPDLPSLYATKLHACFFRKYLKGRDFYDLVWYLGKKIKPNYLLLNRAIEQTQGKSAGLNESTIKDFLISRVKKIDFDAAKKDVERFLEDKTELKLLDKSLVLKSITGVFG